MEKYKLPFDDLIGGNPEQKKKIEENYEKETEEFFKNDKLEYASFEQLLTPEERDELDQILEYVNKVAHSYGASEKTLPKIVVLKPGSVSKITHGKFSSGFCSTYRRRIMVDSSNSKIDFATTIAHEMFHLSGHTVIQYSKKTEDAEFYRSGISVFGKDEKIVYFAEIEEAIVTEAVRIFYDQYLRKDQRFAGEIEKTDFVKGWLKKFFNWAKVSPEKQENVIDNIYSFPDVDDLTEVLRSKKHDEYKFGFLRGYIEAMFEQNDVILRERRKERKKLNSLIDAILEHSKNEYKNQQEVVDVFMRAHFSGKLLPLARMIEKTLGKGSFRSIGKDSAGIR